MIRLIQFLIFGCAHEWETMDERELVREDGASPFGMSKLLRCKKCGDWKRRDLK